MLRSTFLIASCLAAVLFTVPVCAQSPALCTHQAGVEFASTFNDGTGDGLVANCPGFAATRLGLPPFTTLKPNVLTELGFDDSVSQGYNSQVDYNGILKLTNPSAKAKATLTLTVLIGPNCYDWLDPIHGCGLFSETTTWNILPGDTKPIPFHEFIPAAYPQRIYFFLFATATAPLTDCAIQYQSSECGGTL